jgi:uncharacterized sulfatase
MGALHKITSINKFDNVSSFYVTNNKIAFFNSRTFDHFNNGPETNYSEAEINQAALNHLNNIEKTGNPEYPFYQEPSSTSTLSSFFPTKKDQPNVVLIVVESLSSAFSGKGNYLGSYTPFLDSLSEHSLYWHNTISGAERTYGALPNILGGLPFGRQVEGFINDEDLSTKNFETLPSLLTDYYQTKFYYPGWDGFDQTGRFMKLAGAANVYSEYHIEKEYPHIAKYKWGFDDKTMFNFAIKTQANREKPFFNIFLTLGTHNPFDHNPENETIENYLKRKNIVNGKIDRAEIAKTVLLTDDAIKSYFDHLKTTPQFENTIFIITGDHCIGSEIPLKSPIETYRIPLIIYSPMLKRAQNFNSIVSHRDIFQSLTALLKSNFNVNYKTGYSNLGSQLDTNQRFSYRSSSSLHLYSSAVPNFIEGKYYIMGDDLYEITDSLMNSQITHNDSIKNRLQERISDRKILNAYTIGQNKLIE